MKNSKLKRPNYKRKKIKL
jgi:hypothetical protein